MSPSLQLPLLQSRKEQAANQLIKYMIHAQHPLHDWLPQTKADDTNRLLTILHTFHAEQTWWKQQLCLQQSGCTTQNWKDSLSISTSKWLRICEVKLRLENIIVCVVYLLFMYFKCIYSLYLHRHVSCYYCKFCYYSDATCEYECK